MNNFDVKILKRIWPFLESRWISPLGLLIILIFESYFLPKFFWDNFGEGFNTIEFSVIFAIVLVTIIAWMFARKYPKVSRKGKVGIVVAIGTESKKEYIKLKSDLIARLQEVIKLKNKEDFFEIIELPEYYATKVKDKASGNKALKKIRGHFLIYGSCCTRMEGKKNYVLNLEAMVVHSSDVPSIVKDDFSKEFAELFPRKVLFPHEREFSGFEVLKNWIGFVSKYIIGIAAFLSHDFDLSFELFKEVYGELKNIDSNIPQLKKIKARAPGWFSRSALILANKKYF